MMRRKKNRIVILGLLLFLSNNILKAQNMNIEIDTLSDIIVKMKLPLNYKKTRIIMRKVPLLTFTTLMEQ